MRSLPSILPVSLLFHIGRGARSFRENLRTAWLLQKGALLLSFVRCWVGVFARNQPMKLAAFVRDFGIPSRHEAADRSTRLEPRVGIPKSRIRSTPTCLSDAPSSYRMLAVLEVSA